MSFKWKWKWQWKCKCKSNSIELIRLLFVGALKIVIWHATFNLYSPNVLQIRQKTTLAADRDNYVEFIIWIDELQSFIVQHIDPQNWCKLIDNDGFYANATIFHSKGFYSNFTSCTQYVGANWFNTWRMIFGWCIYMANWEIHRQNQVRYATVMQILLLRFYNCKMKISTNTKERNRQIGMG